MTTPKPEPKTILEAIETIVSYLWNDELHDYEANGGPDDHIFRSLDLLNHWTHAVYRGEETFEP